VNRCNANSVPLIFFDLLPEHQVVIFSEAAGLRGCDISRGLREVSKIALVCTKWRDLQQTKDLWTSVFKQFSEHLKYHVDLSLCMGDVDKIKVYVKSLKEFKTLFGECQRKAVMGPNSFHKNMPVMEFSAYLTGASRTSPMYITQLIKKLISEGHLETFAKLLLFRPIFDANKIAAELFKSVILSSSDHSFCFQMMIKSHYDLSEFFKEIASDGGGMELVRQNVYGNEIIRQLFLGQIDGLDVSDYLKSGCDLSAFERNTDDLETNCSLFMHALIIPVPGYYAGKFVDGAIEKYLNTNRLTFSRLSFTDEKLMAIKKKHPLSEKELKQLMHDLVFTCGLNLNIRLESDPVFRQRWLPTLPEVAPVLSFFKAYAHARFMPANNVLKDVWNEYENPL
jgi:hypothetical protein